jgi:biopolymer transport protein ExbD
MRIRKKYQSSSSSEINLTALLDVVFSILAFFILLSSALIVPSRIGIDLPISDRNSSNDPNSNKILLYPSRESIEFLRSLVPNQPKK